MIPITLAVITALTSSAAVAASPSIPKELVGEWCPEEVGTDCDAASEGLVVTSTKIMPGVGPASLGGTRLECTPRGAVRPLSAGVWKIYTTCDDPTKPREVWSVNGAQLTTHDARDHTHRYVRRR